ncbi:MAG: transcription elongation factor GreA [Patescibacteria group bacterium]
MTKEVILTPEGLEKLKQELEKLIKVDRAEIVARIRTAKEFGDLSENAEYEGAKNDQAFTEGRIQELEDMIRRAKVVVHHAGDAIVGIGSDVIVTIDGDSEHYILVGANESDPATGKISIDSPIGKSLVGHKKGETVDIAVPAGKLSAKIIDVK